MEIHTIIFDLGNTLIPFSFEPLRERLEPCRGAATELFALAETGALGPAEFQRKMCGLTGLMEDEFRPWWNSIFDARWLVPPEWMESLMERFRVGLLSNTNAIHFDFLAERHPLLRRLDFRILSHQVGAAKPEIRIYAAAEAAAQCPPSAIFYLDDIADFVAAARRRGWQADTFPGAVQLRATLARYGIQWAAEPRATTLAPSRENASPSAARS